MKTITKPVLRFHERMAGYVSPPVDGTSEIDYSECYEVGHRRGLSIQFETTITHSDLPVLLRDPASPAKIEGTVFAPLLHPRPLEVSEGTFVLLEPHPEAVEEEWMRYRMKVTSPDDPSVEFLLEGHKVIRVGSVLASWKATTTLYVAVYRGVTARSVNLQAAGIMHIGLVDVMHLLNHAEVENVRGIEKKRYLAEFGAMFTRSILPFYGGALEELARFPASVSSQAAHDADSGSELVLSCDPSGVWHETDSLPNACSRLIRHRGGTKGPVMLATGFAMSARSFRHRAGDNESIVDLLLDADYDVWLFDYRAGVDLPSADTQFTLDDVAQLDWPRAVDQVLTVSGSTSVQAFGHCVGSASLLMALLDEENDMAQKVRAVVCSQFSLHPMTSRFKVLEAQLHIGSLLDAIHVQLLHPDDVRSASHVVLDLALNAIPVPSDEQCQQPVCRWINAIFGMTHRHSQLDDATHAELPKMFGVANVRCLEHLGLMMQRAKAVDAHGKDRYLEQPELVKGIPIHFLAGDRNYIFHPEGTHKTIEWLSLHNGGDDYTVDWLPEYAHLDTLIGRDAARDVFPKVLNHFENHQ